jgi:pimeloyl-ACP methyl ester carboxylesterase
MARELGRRELVWLNVSLEGARAETNDAVRGPGVFSRVIEKLEDHEHLKSCFKNVELARAIGTGHFVQLEVPDQANAFIKNFVSRLV